MIASNSYIIACQLDAIDDLLIFVNIANEIKTREEYVYKDKYV